MISRGQCESQTAISGGDMFIACFECSTGNIIPSTIGPICFEDGRVITDRHLVVSSVIRRGDNMIEIELRSSDNSEVFVRRRVVSIKKG